MTGHDDMVIDDNMIIRALTGSRRPSQPSTQAGKPTTTIVPKIIKCTLVRIVSPHRNEASDRYRLHSPLLYPC